MEGPRAVKEEERQELMELLDEVFRPGQRGRMQAEYPHLDDPDKEMLENMIIIKEDGRIAGHVAIIPLEVFVDGSILKVGGIGQVATREEYRGRGFASAILKHCLLKMRDDSCDLSLLWGLRDRYGRFGWELGGKQYVYNLTQRSLPFLNPKTAEIRRYQGDLSDLEKIIGIHDREPLRVVRSKERYQSLLNLPTDEVWLSKTDDNDFSYLVIRGQGERRTVVEFGGEKESLSALLGYIIRKLALENLFFPAPPRHSELTTLLTEASLSWQITSLGMVGIMDLEKSLEKLRGNMKANLTRAGWGRKGKVTLEILETNQRVTLEIDEDIHLSHREASTRIKLSQREMVRLLFGLDAPGKTFAFKDEIRLLLDQIFPLDLYVWSLDHI